MSANTSALIIIIALFSVSGFAMFYFSDFDKFRKK